MNSRYQKLAASPAEGDLENHSEVTLALAKAEEGKEQLAVETRVSGAEQDLVFGRKMPMTSIHKQNNNLNAAVSKERLQLNDTEMRRAHVLDTVRRLIAERSALFGTNEDLDSHGSEKMALSDTFEA